MEFDERLGGKSNQLKWQGIGGEEEFNQVVKEGTGWNGDGANNANNVRTCHQEGRKFVVLEEIRSHGKSWRRKRNGGEGEKQRERSRPYATTFIDRGSAIRAIKCMQSRVNFIELSGGAKFCPAAVKCGGLNGHQGNA